MDFEARVISFVGETTGTNKAGKLWKKKEWVVETPGQYPHKVKVQAFNDRADSLNLQLDQSYIFSVDLDSREFNGRWYTDVTIFRVQEMQGGPQGNFGPQQGYQGGYQGGFQNNGGQQNFANPQPGPYGTGGGQVDSFSVSVEESDEDLPF